ncbi:ATP-binding protein [Acidipila sp. EB88]|uniref:ATP-binding protein n=1 Tax=Acidipila sp. EB88 TaxID=2305226 RepID=UPI000F5DDFCE|nr:ATP-binding protein [Acidipila sp. EB88]RRA49306.1 ATP-binding protein [Acidipila sp. EB88]
MIEDKVDIRPGVSVLGILRYLNYKPWYALGEFVDNSVQSFLSNRTAIEQVDGSSVRLKVSIDLDPHPNHPQIRVRDNGAGIAAVAYSRAFRPAAIPDDRSGLSEFGMGMKSAACWFAPRWSVRTSALGESVAKTVAFDIATIVRDDISELTIKQIPERPERHYTEIVLDDVFQMPVGRTVGKLKEHLADIYRVFLRNGELELCFNGETLRYEEPKVLQAPSYKEKNGEPLLWRKQIQFDLGHGMRVDGFAALRATANVAKAGFALFRRNRVIEGSGDEGYRPHQVFGNSNSYRYQRLFGELNLHGFDVSHTKDGFRWDENEEPFLDLLREHLDSDELPLLKQAENYRVRESKQQLLRSAQHAVTNTAAAMESRLESVLPQVAGEPPTETGPVIDEVAKPLAQRKFNLKFRDEEWCIVVEVSDDAAESQWLVVRNGVRSPGGPRELQIQMSIIHPFMVRYAQGDSEDVEAFLRMGAALALAEVTAREAGVKGAGTVRRNLNEILSEVLSEI